MIAVRPTVVLTILACVFAPSVHADEPISIGSRLELFVDEYLIDTMKGDLELTLQRPQPQEVALVTDAPWEGNTCAYYTVFQDGDLYRMYYRGSHFDTQTRKTTHPEFACYAESKDGIHWAKPELGLVEFQGSKQNNIVWNGVGTHGFTPFKDLNPACSQDARYKALGQGSGSHKRGLYAFKSPDGIHWTLMSPEPVITKGAFDSQNLAFWDPVRELYVDFHRIFSDGVRDIMTCTSGDFLNWTEPVLLQYTGAPKEHLYTNAIRVYERAPHIYIGFPTRFLPKTQQVEPTFMSSRDGRNFHRWPQALIPITAPADRDGNRSNYMTWGLVKLPGKDNEYSVYATEAYYTGPDSRVRRFTYRVDGFVSVHAGPDGGLLLTKPMTFSGNKLVVNFKTSEKGSLRVEMQDAAGQTIEGLSLADSIEMTGDAIDEEVSWKDDAGIRPLAGKTIRLCFQLVDGDLFSFQFRD